MIDGETLGHNLLDGGVKVDAPGFLHAEVDDVPGGGKMQGGCERVLALPEAIPVVKVPAISDIPTSQRQGVATPCLQPIIACS